MKRQFIFPVLASSFFFACQNAPEQENAPQTEEAHAEMADEEEDMEAQLISNVNATVEAILDKDWKVVADNVDYPIRRENPIPAITTTEEFIAQAPIIFDEKIMSDLEEYLAAPDIIDLTNSNGQVGILSGQLWFWEDGTITAINYHSDEEMSAQDELYTAMNNFIHPLLKDYKHNVYLGQTDKFIIRVDETEEGLRYASWSNSFTMNDEPDLVLYNGTSEKQGSGGNWQIRFENGEYEYIIDQIVMGAEETSMGDFLVIKKDGELISESPCTEVTNPGSLIK